MKQGTKQRRSTAQIAPRRPVRQPMRDAAPVLGEILRTAQSAEEIADALVRTAGTMETAQTRLW